MSHVVEFDPAYQKSGRLAVPIRQAAVVLLPYDSPRRFASGVLSEAIAAQRPIVATGFPTPANYSPQAPDFWCRRVIPLRWRTPSAGS